MSKQISPDAPRLVVASLMCYPTPSNRHLSFFSQDGVGAERLNEIQKAISGADQIVVYSEREKRDTLIQKYDRDPDTIHVVPHSTNTLTDYIRVTSTTDDERAVDILCREHLRRTLLIADNVHVSGFRTLDFQFLFYASQFRPNKNVISLLRAYEYLLREKFVGLKLVLTGNPTELPSIQRFVQDRDLARDVIFLHNVSLQQLAACYRLAAVAVNPSLSEGGFPFTFTEALSVGTPALMGRIAVTEEVIADPELQSAMLFNPYDWEDIAHRIEWAIANRSKLLSMQIPLYNRMGSRTWRNVVR